jgi:hypothetical protein
MPPRSDRIWPCPGLLLTEITRLRILLAAEIIVVFETLCKNTHKNLLAGKCPWCGQVVINGHAEPAKPASNSLPPTGLRHVRLNLMLLIGLVACTIIIAIAVPLMSAGSPVAQAATRMALVLWWGLAAAFGLCGGVGLATSVAGAILWAFVWHAAWTRRRSIKMQFNDEDRRPGNRSDS